MSNATSSAKRTEKAADSGSSISCIRVKLESGKSIRIRRGELSKTTLRYLMKDCDHIMAAEAIGKANNSAEFNRCQIRALGFLA